MKISDIFGKHTHTLSFEVFPPKTTDAFDTVREATEKVAALKPSYMSVTYGAGGTGSRFTLPIAENIEKHYGITVVHHLTCVGSTRESVRGQLVRMREAGIENVLALRGDIPEGADRSSWSYRYASELTADITAFGGFCIGGACYPEGHPEAESLERDIENLRNKVDAGCEFLTTQLFFDNNLYYGFVEKCAAAGIHVPVTAGIMPVTSVRQFARIASLSGSSIPTELVGLAEKYSGDAAAMRAGGIAYAACQIRDLFDNGVRAVHLYTMNNASVAAEIQAAVAEYLASED